MGKNNKKNKVANVGPVLENTAPLNDADTLVLEAEAKKEEVSAEKVLSEKVEKKANKAVKVDSKKKKAKKDKKESKITRRLKETGSELKKVTWPTFRQTMKKTGVVLAVVIFFGVVLFAFDYILSVCTKLLAGSKITAVQQWVAVGLAAAVVVGAIVWITIWAVRKKKADRR